jgi:hypothetical protein
MAKKKPKKKPAPKPKSKRASLKSFLQKFLTPAREAIQDLKFRSDPGPGESQEEGIERTRKLELAQARFDAIREIHDAL